VDGLRRLAGNVSRYIARHDLIPAGSTVIVGVSGGPDSMFLLHVLNLLAPEHGWSLTAAHVNHLLRAEESDGDEEFVRRSCGAMAVPFRLLRTDIRTAAEQSGESLESAGRRARYRFFETLADEAETAVDPEKASRPVRIAVAHHRDDQAETILMHLCRGSGLEGLAGMAPANGRIVRPLLELSHTEMEEALASSGIPYRTDSTNRLPEATRNRVRMELIPLAEELFGPGLSRRLAGTAEMLRNDAAFLEEAASGKAVRIRRDGGVDRKVLAGMPTALSGRVIRILYGEVRGSRTDLGRDHVAAVLSAAGSDRSLARADLPGGMRAVCADGVLRIEPRVDRRQSEILSAPVPLILAGKTEVSSGCFIAAERETEVRVSASSCRGNVVAAFRKSSLAGAVIRPRRQGDRIRAVGRPGSRSLKRFLIDRKVPAGMRDRRPIVAVGDRVAWIPGIAVSSEHAWNPECDAITDCVWMAYCPKG